MSTHLIALDIGTQSIRAAVVTPDGTILGIGQVKHEVDSPQPGWAQQNPDSWWKNLCNAIAQVLNETAIKPDSIAAIAACGQMHGPVGIDKNGDTTTPWVQLWCDKRCAPQCETLRQNHDEPALAKIAGSSVNPAWTGLKVRWIKDNDPKAYEKSKYFLVPKDFINFKLTGIAAADPSEASGSFLWDCTQNTYSAQLAQTVGVDLQKFAPVKASHEVIGHVTAQAAKQTQLPEGTPVVAGGGDFPVSMLGFGIVGEGITADVTGTSSLLASHSAKPLVHPAVQNLRHVVDGWIPFTILDCGGLSMKWCKDLVASLTGDDIDYDQLIEKASKVPPASEGLLFYPYMLGERRRENTTARGGFFGITLNHTGGHFIRAVMEGVAFGMGKDVELFKTLGLEISEILCVGGGTRNALWNQIKADVMQMPLVLSKQPEAGLKGAALLASAGAGLIEDPAKEALARRTTERTIKPTPQNAQTCKAALAEYCRVYDHMLGFWRNQ
jgi:D-xylulose kinase